MYWVAVLKSKKRVAFQLIFNRLIILCQSISLLITSDCSKNEFRVLNVYNPLVLIALSPQSQSSVFVVNVCIQDKSSCNVYYK